MELLWSGPATISTGPANDPRGPEMSSKRLIVCCDNTWNDADSAGEFTNVSEEPTAQPEIRIRQRFELGTLKASARMKSRRGSTRSPAWAHCQIAETARCYFNYNVLLSSA